jgi:hypothetical protein
MAGDFKQPKTNWPQEALTGAHEILREFGDVRKIMLAGNHDAMGLGGSGLAPFKDVATVIEGEAEQVSDLLCVPFGADLKAVKTNKHLPIIAHAFIKGAFLGPEDHRLPDKGVDIADYGPFPVAFFGDIHNAQFRRSADPLQGRTAAWYTINSAGQVRVPGRWLSEVYYPGSPYQQNWGERDHVKGVLLVDTKRGAVDFVPMNAPRFIHVELTDCEILPEVLLNASQQSDFVRIITPSSRWTQSALDARGLHFRSMQIIEQKAAAVQKAARTVMHAGMDPDELLSGYMKAKPLPPGMDSTTVMTAHRRLWGGEE